VIARGGTRDPDRDAAHRQARPEVWRAGDTEGAKVRTVPSAELLGETGLLHIEHDGEIYSLRRTRNGRLILTK
jgi:hemin uptake protein HemP